MTDKTSRKGKNPFKGYQVAKVNRFAERLELLLKGLAMKGIVHPSFGVLVNDVAERLGRHPWSLKRNKTYSTMLLTHYAGLPGGAALLNLEEVPDDAPPEVLKAMLLAARVELGHLKNHSERLERRVKALESGELIDGQLIIDTSLETLASTALVPAAKGPSGRQEFEDAAMIIFLIWERFQGFLRFEERTGDIVERGGEPGNERIVGTERTKALFEWLRENKDILGFKFAEEMKGGRK